MDFKRVYRLSTLLHIGWKGITKYSEKITWEIVYLYQNAEESDSCVVIFAGCQNGAQNGASERKMLHAG